MSAGPSVLFDYGAWIGPSRLGLFGVDATTGDLIKVRNYSLASSYHLGTLLMTDAGEAAGPALESIHQHATSSNLTVRSLAERLAQPVRRT